MHLRRNITHKCLLSQPVSALSSFKSSQSVMVCFKENLLWWRNNISGLKDFCACFYHAPKILSRGTKHPGWKRLATLNWKWKGSFQVYTQFRSWFLKKSITRCTFLKCGARMHTKNYIAKFPFFSAIKLPPCELVVFTDLIWTCIYLQKTGISKYSWKKIIQLLWTVLTYLLKKCWRWNLTCY